MNIKEMRKDKGLTQKQLAEQIGVNIRWVQKLEAGDTKLENITFLNAIKLIRALTPYDDEKQLRMRTAEISIIRCSRHYGPMRCS